MTVKESRARYHDAVNTYMNADDTTDARDELAGALLEYRMDCVALVERLTHALEPFDAEARLWHKTTKDGDFIYTVRDASDLPNTMQDSPLTVGDLRAIADIYGEVV